MPERSLKRIEIETIILFAFVTDAVSLVGTRLVLYSEKVIIIISLMSSRDTNFKEINSLRNIQQAEMIKKE